MLAMLLALAGCGGAPKAAEPVHADVALDDDEPIDAPTNQIKVVYGHDRLFCFRDAELTSLGGCGRTMEECSAVAGDTRAREHPKECEEVTAGVCFRGTHVVSGDAMEQCYPTMTMCVSMPERFRKNVDLANVGDCFVYRVNL